MDTKQKNNVDIKFDGKVFTLRGFYHIDKERCDTSGKLLGWILHLSEKNWFDREWLLQFVHIVTEQMKINIDWA
jgi:hypothetical protein